MPVVEQPLKSLPPSTPAQSLWSQRELLKEGKEELLKLKSALDRSMGGPRDFVRQQWMQIASFALAFRPEVIIELGRGYGNSTCLFTWVANRVPGCKVISYCLSDSWRQQSYPQLSQAMGQAYFSPLTAHETNILNVDFAPIVADKQRVFVFWDAHGFDVAQYVIAKLFPLLVFKESIIAVHDTADLSFMPDDAFSYDSRDLWLKYGVAEPKFILGKMGTQYEEGVVLMDFANRNGIDFASVESSYFNELSNEQFQELEKMLGAENLSRYGHWHYLTLNNCPKQKLSFPMAPEPLQPMIPANPSEPAHHLSVPSKILRKIFATRKN